VHDHPDHRRSSVWSAAICINIDANYLTEEVIARSANESRRGLKTPARRYAVDENILSKTSTPRRSKADGTSKTKAFDLSCHSSGVEESLYVFCACQADKQK